MADKKNPPSPFGGGMKPPSFGAPKTPSKGFTPQGAPSAPSAPAHSAKTPTASSPVHESAVNSGGQNYAEALKSKIEQAKKTLKDSHLRKKENLEKRELYWMGILKEKEAEAEALKQEMKGALENMEISRAEKETALRDALEQFEGRLMSVSRELEDEKKKSYRSMQKAREESEASLKIEMALKEIVSSKDYEDKLQNLQNARENLLKDMIKQKDNFNREKTALEEQIGRLSDQISNQREIISRQESAEKFFEAQKEKDIEAARAEAKTRLKELINQVKGREESVRLKENEFRLLEFANKHKLSDLSDELREKESALAAMRGTASHLERELSEARNALEEGNSKFVKEIEWLKKHFEEERRAWSNRFDKESRFRKEIASSHTDVVKERDAAFRELAFARAEGEDLSSRLAEKEKDIANIKNDFEKEKTDIKNAYETAAQRITDSRDALGLDVSAADSEIKRLSSEKNKFAENISNLEEQIRAQDKNIKSLDVQISELSSDKNKFGNKIKTLTEEKETAVKKIAEYASERTALEDKLKNRAAALASALSELDEAKNVISSLNSRLSESKKELSDFLRREQKLEEKISQYESDIERLNKDIISIKTESDRTVAAKDRELEKASAEIKELNGKLSGFIEEKSKIASKVEAIYKELFDMTKQRDILFDEKNVLSEELAGQKTEIEKLLGEAAERSAAIAETTKEITLLKDKLKNLSVSRGAETVELKNKILEQHSKMEELFLRINEYNIEIEELKAAPRETVEEYKQKLLERQNSEAEMRSELEELRAEKERGAAKDGAIKEYEGKIAFLEEKLSATETEIEKMREQAGAAAEMDAQIVRKDAQLKEVSGELKELRDRVEFFEKAKFDDREKFDTEIKAIKDEYNQRRAEIEERTKAFEETKAELEELQIKNKALSDKNISLLEQKDKIAESTGKISQIASQKEKEVEDLKKRLDLSAGEISASYEKKLKKLSAEADENRARSDSFENQLKEAEKEIANLKESSDAEAGLAGGLNEKLRELGEIIDRQKKDIAEQMDYIKDKELEFHKILKKKDEDISVLKAQLEIGLEALSGKSAPQGASVRHGGLSATADGSPARRDETHGASSEQKLDELQKINDEIKRKSVEREAMLREEIERKEKEASEYRNQIKAAESKALAGNAGAPSELEDEIKLRAAEAVRLKAEMERTKNYYERLEGIIKKQDKKISRLQNKEAPDGVIKKHDIVSDDDGNIKF